MSNTRSQNPTQNKPLDVAMLDYFNWANANTFGKERSRKDVYEYGLELYPTAPVFHPESDALRNITGSALNIAFAPIDSETNMMLNIDRINASDYLMVKSFREWKLGAAITANTVASVGTPVTAQTIALTGLTALAYYVISIPCNKASTLSIGSAAATLVKNSQLLTIGGLPAGLNTFMFQMATGTTAVTFTLTAALGVGLATGTNAAIKLFPITLWTPQELKIISCSG